METISLYCVFTINCYFPQKKKKKKPCSYKETVLNIHWKDWCWSWNSNTLAIWCKELIHWKRPWCWGRLKVGGEGDKREWDDWMASLTRWTWDWVGFGSWWWTGRPGMLQSMGWQRVGQHWATDLIKKHSPPVLQALCSLSRYIQGRNY